MDLSLFDFDLPPERIAQQPLADRAAARLLRLNRATGATDHRIVRELPGILRPGDLLVVNDTAVVPAKLSLRRRSGGRVGGLFLREIEAGLWLVLLNSKGRLKVGESLLAAGHEDVTLTIERRTDEGQWEVGVRMSPSPFQGEGRGEGQTAGNASVAQPPPAVLRTEGPTLQPSAEGTAEGGCAPCYRAVEILARIGQTPLPPYIRREAEQPGDRARYQTVFAREPGAVAAPTAGLHLTEPLLAELAAAGIEHVAVTLHVGLGTFEPVRSEQIELHHMHSEWLDCPPATADAVNAARAAGRRVVAVGTTSVRVLESCFDDQAGGLRPRTGWTDIFIFPGYRFRAVDALLTNFHLPRSSLLMLVAAFADQGPGPSSGRFGKGDCPPSSGCDLIMAAYREAINRGYRFYSYGDAMLIE